MASVASSIGADRGVSVQLEALIALRLRVNRLGRPSANRVAGSYSASHASRARGRGVDYVESRSYQPGDDIRHMDWRVTARSGRPHTKLFEVERERSVLIVINHNSSMRFGTRARFKSVQAARAAALLAWATSAAGDRIGAIGYGPGLNAEVRPTGGARGALHVLRALVEWDQSKALADALVPLSQGLVRAHRLARPGSQVVVITDGFDADAGAEQPLAALAQHCDVAALLISDPLELHAPPPARYAVENQAGRTLLDFNAAQMRMRWPQLFAERRQCLIDMFERRRLAWVALETPAEPESALARLPGFGPRRKLR